ncbi:MAG: methyltransferase domain-containing protein [Dongiaceae bacterium]
MQEADRQFVGSIPALYDRYLVPFLFEPYARDMAGRLAGLRSGRLLEIACGTGAVTRAMAAALPAAVEIVATDLNQPMLDYAAKQPIARPVTWRQADALALPFADAGFDTVICQFGAMFFPDKEAAYREARRVLRPGGRLIFSVWDRLEANEASAVLSAAVAACFPDDPPRFVARTPHGYHDAAAILAALGRAGFSEMAAEIVPARGRAAAARELAIGLCQGSPLRGEIEARDAARLAAVTDAAAAALARAFGDGPVDTAMQAILLTARA